MRTHDFKISKISRCLVMNSDTQYRQTTELYPVIATMWFLISKRRMDRRYIVSTMTASLDNQLVTHNWRINFRLVSGRRSVPASAGPLVKLTDDFRGFPQFMLGRYHDRERPLPSKPFPTDLSSYHLMLYSLHTKSVVKWLTKQNKCRTEQDDVAVMLYIGVRWCSIRT
jgi:hypothetical protein